MFLGILLDFWLPIITKVRTRKRKFRKVIPNCMKWIRSCVKWIPSCVKWKDKCNSPGYNIHPTNWNHFWYFPMVVKHNSNCIWNFHCPEYNNFDQSLGHLKNKKIVYFCLFIQLLSLIHIWRCRRSTLCRSRWSPYH